MKRFIPLLLVALAALRIAPAQPLDSLCTKTEHRIAMRDGVRLHTTVYAPTSTGATSSSCRTCGGAT